MGAMEGLRGTSRVLYSGIAHKMVGEPADTGGVQVNPLQVSRVCA